MAVQQPIAACTAVFTVCIVLCIAMCGDNKQKLAYPKSLNVSLHLIISDFTRR